MKKTNETINQMRGVVVKITNKDNLKLGTPHRCYHNAAVYALENNCNYVCGWIENGYGYPHCICEMNGEYIDPTLNEEYDFKIFHIYTAEEIWKIFNEEGYAFIPFEGCKFVKPYDGMRKLKKEEVKEWRKYIEKIEKG